jgi:membrane protease YdiL (CAAX protease family)
LRTRDIFFGPEKLRAVWRLLLFSAITVVTLMVLGIAASLVLARVELVGRLWELAIPSGIAVLAMLFSSWVMMRWVERRRFAALGFPLGREAWRGLGMGAVIGGGFIVVLVALQMLVGWVELQSEAGTLTGWLSNVGGLALLLAVAATAEELLFRGYAFQVLVEAIGVPLAVVLSSAAFGALHVFNPEVSLVAVANIGLAGVIMAAAYLRTRSLWAAIGLHWGWNWVMAAVLDLPVSGIDFDTPGYETLMPGPDAVTGGAFGPEGSVLTTLLSVPLIVWLFRTPWLTESARMVALRPLMDSRVGAVRQSTFKPEVEQR